MGDFMDIAITKVSSKGQVVIPREIRTEAGFKEGEKLMVYGDKSTVILKKIESPAEAFRKLASFGQRFAKKARIKKRDVLKDD